MLVRMVYQSLVKYKEISHGAQHPLVQIRQDMGACHFEQVTVIIWLLELWHWYGTYSSESSFRD